MTDIEEENESQYDQELQGGDQYVKDGFVVSDEELSDDYSDVSSVKK